MDKPLNAGLSRRHLIASLIAGGSLGLTSSSLVAAPRRKLFFERIGKPIGLQLYTLGDDVGKDIDATFAKVAAIGFRDIQLPQLFGKEPAEMKAAADRAGLSVSCLHLAVAPGTTAAMLSMKSDTQRIVDDLGALGVKDAVMPIMLFPENFKMNPGEDFKSGLARNIAEAGADLWKRTADFLNEKATALAPHGITVGYHNHNFEFAPIGKTTGWEILTKGIDPMVKLEVDVGWVTAAGLDPVAFLRKYKGRVRWLHVKDVQASTKSNFALSMDPTEVGSGKQNWPAILQAAHKAGCQHYYIEQEAPFTMARIDAAAKGYAYLKAMKG